MLLDCRSLESKFVSLPKDLALIVTDSGVKHAHPESGYNVRHDECHKAVQALQAADPGMDKLRDVTAERIERDREVLGELLYRRSRHVVSEIARVGEAFAALETADLDTLGKLVQASHASLREDFEVSCDEIETLVGIADSCDGVLGSRMLGGGFGGCVLSVARKQDEKRIMDGIVNAYGKVLGRPTWIHAVTPAPAAGEVTTA